MNGKPYCSFRKGNAEFFALDTNFMDPRQLKWIDHELGASVPPGRSVSFITLCIRTAELMGLRSNFESNWSRFSRRMA